MLPTKGGGTKKSRPAQNRRRPMSARPKRAPPRPLPPLPHVPKFGKLLYYSSP